MEPRIQYAKTSDGVSIAYWTMGEGGIPLIMTSPMGFGHADIELREPTLRAWYERLAAHRMIVRYDQRGQGLSQRDLEPYAWDHLAGDFDMIADLVLAERVDLFGFFGPCTYVLHYARSHPERVRKVALWSPLVDSRSHSTPRMRALIGLIEKDYDLFCETFARNALGWTGDQAHVWATFIRQAINQEDAALLFRAWETDVTEDVENCSAQVLVLSHTTAADRLESARFIASSVPEARLFMLPGPVKPPFELEDLTHAVEEFLDEDEPAQRELTSGMAVILFLDIAGSTELTSQLGDAAYRERERDLDGALRQAISAEGGTPITGKVLGDGVMATFSSARQAIDAARACRDLGGEAGLPLHVGIHAGDVVREGNNVHGGAVQVAARVQGVAAAGEVLVSQTVRDLARTSAGVAFEDRGEHELTGVDEPQRLFAVRSSTGSG